MNNLSDFKKVLASRMGLDHDALNLWGSKHPLLQQTEFSHVADDTELEVPSLPSSEVGPQEISLPLNDRETYRIKRGCLLLENFCALFYLGPDRHFDTRHHPHRFNHCPRSSRRRAFRNEQAIFFKNYVNPWEVGEVAVITQFMYDLVRCVHSRAKFCPDPKLPDTFPEQEETPSLGVPPNLLRRLMFVSRKGHADSEIPLGKPSFTNTNVYATMKPIILGLGAGAGDNMARTDITTTKRWWMSLTTMWSGMPARV